MASDLEVLARMGFNVGIKPTHANLSTPDSAEWSKLAADLSASAGGANVANKLGYGAKAIYTAQDLQNNAGLLAIALAQKGYNARTGEAQLRAALTGLDANFQNAVVQESWNQIHLGHREKSSTADFVVDYVKDVGKLVIASAASYFAVAGAAAAFGGTAAASAGSTTAAVAEGSAAIEGSGLISVGSAAGSGAPTVIATATGGGGFIPTLSSVATSVGGSVIDAISSTAKTAGKFAVDALLGGGEKGPSASGSEPFSLYDSGTDSGFDLASLFGLGGGGAGEIAGPALFNSDNQTTPGTNPALLAGIALVFIALIAALFFARKS